MNNEIIPFGKYKGQPIEILKSDEKYLIWLQSQDWFKSQYQSINTLIVNNFAEPSETPEHNKLQVLFLDDDFCRSFIVYASEISETRRQRMENNKWTYCETDFTITGVVFEENGLDVIIKCKDGWFNIELKPSISDDYPAVLRQILNNKSRYVVCEKFTAKGATLNQAKKIFMASDKYLIVLSEFYKS